jgi:malate synthase
MLLEYLEGWLNGRGAKGIDTLAGKPGTHPALMEDLATARISVAQLAQRIRHGARDASTGQAHDFALVKRSLKEEFEGILDALKDTIKSASAYRQAEERYQKALKISYRWIKNYTELNFRSLGSYTRVDLDSIAAQADAF